MTQPTPPDSPFYPRGNAHPLGAGYNGLEVIRDHIEQIDAAERYPDSFLTTPPHEPREEPWAFDPVGGERQHIVPPQPHEIRTPATIHYPKSREILFLQSGVNVPDHMLGFAGRSFAVQNLGTNNFLFCPELNMYITSGPTTFASYNIPEGTQKLSFQWHTALFNPVTPAPVAGQGAIVWIYDEWVIPSVVIAGNVVTIAGQPISVTGTVTTTPPSSNTAAQTNVAQNVASVALLAANAARKDASIFNDSTAGGNLYLSFVGAASLTNFKVKLAPGGYWSATPGTLWTGLINGIWDAAGAGAARVTEET